MTLNYCGRYMGLRLTVTYSTSREQWLASLSVSTPAVVNIVFKSCHASVLCSLLVSGMSERSQVSVINRMQLTLTILIIAICSFNSSIGEGPGIGEKNSRECWFMWLLT